MTTPHLPVAHLLRALSVAQPVLRVMTRFMARDIARVMAQFSRWALCTGAGCVCTGAWAQPGSGCEWAAQVPAEQGLACQVAGRSADGRWLAVGGGTPPVLRLYAVQPGLYLPPGDTLRVLPDNRSPAYLLAATHPVALLTGQAAAGVHAVFSAPHRRSLVVGLDGLPELWELNLDPAAEPIHDGLVHDYRMGEAIAKRGFLGVRRTPLVEPVRVLGTDASGTHVFTAPTHAPLRVEVINLDVRRAIATLPVPQGVQLQTAQRRVCQGKSAVVLGTFAPGQQWAVAARMPWPTVRDCDD